MWKRCGQSSGLCQVPDSGQDREDRVIAKVYFFQRTFNTDLHTVDKGLVIYDQKTISKGLLLAFFELAKQKCSEQGPAQERPVLVRLCWRKQC